jgi:hypothetical protein
MCIWESCNKMSMKLEEKESNKVWNAILDQQKDQFFILFLSFVIEIWTNLKLNVNFQPIL